MKMTHIAYDGKEGPDHFVMCVCVCVCMCVCVFFFFFFFFVFFFCFFYSLVCKCTFIDVIAIFSRRLYTYKTNSVRTERTEIYESSSWGSKMKVTAMLSCEHVNIAHVNKTESKTSSNTTVDDTARFVIANYRLATTCNLCSRLHALLFTQL